MKREINVYWNIENTMTTQSLVDLYQVPNDKNDLNEKLSTLEYQATNILSKARNAFNQQQILELTRMERDTLRKFLFIKKYRHSEFHHRYNHNPTQKYNISDHHRMTEYMKRKHLQHPEDIWFDNLRGLLDLDLEDSDWGRKIMNNIYPDDAAFFIIQVQGSFMAFCTPESVDDEFVMTRNAHIAEGQEYHSFFPISPRLMIILRSNLLRDASIQKRSILDDLPIQVSRSSYTAHVDWKPLSEHRFFFSCFKLSPTHVSIINQLLRNEHTTSIIHDSTYTKASATYLREDRGRRHSSNKGRLYEQRVKKNTPSPGRSRRGKKSSKLHMAQYVAIKVGSQLIQKRHMLQLYQLFRPEAAIKSLWHDIDQASKMVLMRIKTDVALHNSSLSYTEKETVKLNRQKLFMNLPAERVWLYLKICRNMSKFDKDDFKMQISALEIEGIEDGYAKLIGDSPKQELIRDMYLHATT